MTRTPEERGLLTCTCPWLPGAGGAGVRGDPLNQWAMEAHDPSKFSEIQSQTVLCSSFLFRCPDSSLLLPGVVAKPPPCTRASSWILLLWMTGQEWGTQAKTKTSHPTGHPGGVHSTCSVSTVRPPGPRSSEPAPLCGSPGPGFAASLLALWPPFFF